MSRTSLILSEVPQSSSQLPPHRANRGFAGYVEAHRSCLNCRKHCSDCRPGNRCVSQRLLPIETTAVVLYPELSRIPTDRSLELDHWQSEQNSRRLEVSKAVLFCLRDHETRPRHPRLLAWRNYSSQSFGASSILLFKAAGTAIYASKIPHAVVCAPSRTLLFPDADPRQG